MRALMLPLAFLLLLSAGPAWAFTSETLEQNGPSYNRIDVVILGDGYTAAQQTKLKTDALALIGYVFTQTPFKEYRTHYNFHLVHVISNESGADIPSDGISRDTALDATYDSYGIRRLLVVNNAKATAAAASVPEVDIIFVLVNDAEYGGSGGQVLVASVHEQSPEIVAHEIGHTLGDLADEYEDPYPDYPTGCSEANVACTTVRTAIKWAPWIAADTPLPTPETEAYGSVVGAFQGARYLSSDIWRPMLNCRMRKLGQSFCSICTERLIEEGYSRVSPSDAKGETLTIASDQLLRFDAKPIEPADHALQIRWTLDGAPANGDSVLQIQASSLASGQHKVEATLADTSERLRLPAAKKAATDTVTWTVNIEGTLTPDGDPETVDTADEDSADTLSEEAEDETDTESDGLDGDSDLDAEAEAVTDGDVEQEAEEDIWDPAKSVFSGCSSGGGTQAWLALILLLALPSLRRRWA